MGCIPTVTGKREKLKKVKRVRKKKLKLTSLILLLMVAIICAYASSVNASLGTFKQNSCVNLRVLNSCSSNALIEVSSSNETFIINEFMTNLGGQTFSYNFCNTSTIGTYTFSWNPDCYTCQNGNCGNDFDITYSGRPNASDNLTVFFVVLFLILIGASCYLVLYTLGHMITLDFDLIDLSLDLGLFFVIVFLYFLQQVYIGNAFMDFYLLLFIEIGAVLFVLVPIIAFILNVTWGAWQRKSLKMEAPRKWRFRR